MEKHPFDRIIGGTDMDKAGASIELQELFDLKNEMLEKYEVEKTPEEIILIEKTITIVDRMVTQYGGTVGKLPEDHIYVLRPGAIALVDGGKFHNGYHSPLGAKIGVDRTDSPFIFSAVLAHELFHLKSYKAARIYGRGDVGHVGLYRSGLAMVDTKDPGEMPGDEKYYFAMLEEAIVAECTIKFTDELSQDPIFIEDARAINMFKDWFVGYYTRNGGPEEMMKEFQIELRYIANPQEMAQKVLDHSPDEKVRQAYAVVLLDKLHLDKKLNMVERYKERKMLYKLLDLLVQNSDGRFQNTDEVFTELAKANFSGHYLGVARMIENILGKGAFRKLAEEFSSEPE
jgi:hypothetical protein